MIVEVVGGAQEHPEARVVDVDNLTALHLALGEVTDEEAAEVLERTGLGRFHDSTTAFLDAATLRAAAEPDSARLAGKYKATGERTSSGRFW